MVLSRRVRLAALHLCVIDSQLTCFLFMQNMTRFCDLFLYIIPTLHFSTYCSTDGAGTRNNEPVYSTNYLAASLAPLNPTPYFLSTSRFIVVIRIYYKISLPLSNQNSFW